MKKKYFLITIICVLFSLTSCSTEEGVETSVVDILSAKSWVIQSKLISPTITMSGIEITDIAMLESEAVRNYTFNFNSDGSLLVQDASNATILETTWSLSSDETQLIFTNPLIYTYPVVGDMELSSMVIQSISGTKMVCTITTVYYDTNYVVTVTFI
ncbi:hypothetical protein [Mariniflexile sp.]|uniref:hypothetical protein n=1 Tax=Mariniflexile sp. TaxID=1979402 RepID=UPI003569A350